MTATESLFFGKLNEFYNKICHVRTAPSWQGFSLRLQVGRCGRVFGLVVRFT